MSDLGNKFFTPSQVANYISELMNGDVFLNNLIVQGEVAGLKPSARGHLYFEIKDQGAVLRVAVWASTIYKQPDFRKIQNGQIVRLYGAISNYEAGGSYSLVANQVQLGDAGDIDAQFKKTFEKFSKAGYLDSDRKKPIPTISQKVGVVTSPTGAVLHDIQQTIARRFPMTQVELFASAVQGDGAVDEMITALQRADESDVDIIILARGGGSKTELSIFNNERLNLALLKLHKPVVSSIGHQVDITLVDFVSDKKADTPTAAAEIVTPDINGLSSQLHDLKNQLMNQIINKVVEQQHQLDFILKSDGLGIISRRVDQKLMELNYQVDKLLVSSQKTVSEIDNEFKLQNQKLQSLDPNLPLKRGFAIIKDESGNTLDVVEKFASGEDINIRVSNGSVKGSVK